MSDNDDVLVGRLLSRREMLGLMGAAGVTGAAFIVGCSDDGDDATPTSAATQPSGGATLGATTAPTAASTSTGATPSCVVVPELTEGPYFVDEMLNRSDIRRDPSSGERERGRSARHHRECLAGRRRRRLHAAGRCAGRRVALRRARRV